MSEINNNVIYPHNIIAPNLTESNYGENIKEQFSNIDRNFKVLGNYDFIKGQQGDSLYIKNIGLIKDNIAEDGLLVENTQGEFIKCTIQDEAIKQSALIGYQMYNALKNTIQTWCESNLSNNTDFLHDPLSFIGDENNGIYNWDDIIKYTTDIESGVITDIKYNYSVPIVVLQDKLHNVEHYICSAGLILFTDNRFCADALSKYQYVDIENGYEEHITDVTCFPIFNYENEEWNCELNTSFPRLKYVENKNYNGDVLSKSLYWVIGEDNTLIKATGIRGEKGNSAKIWISRIKTSSLENNAEFDLREFFIDGEWINIYEDESVIKPLKDDLVVVYQYLKDDPDYLGYFISSIQTREIISNLSENIEIAYFTQVPLNNITHINYQKNTIEFFKSISGIQYDINGDVINNPEDLGIEPAAKGLFLLFNSGGNIRYMQPEDNEGLPSHIIYNSTKITSINNNGKFNCALNIKPVTDFNNPENTTIQKKSQNYTKYNPELNISYDTNIEGDLNINGDVIVGNIVDDQDSIVCINKQDDPGNGFINGSEGKGYPGKTGLVVCGGVGGYSPNPEVDGGNGGIGLIVRGGEGGLGNSNQKGRDGLAILAEGNSKFQGTIEVEDSSTFKKAITVEHSIVAKKDIQLRKDNNILTELTADEDNNTLIQGSGKDLNISKFKAIDVIGDSRRKINIDHSQNSYININGGVYIEGTAGIDSETTKGGPGGIGLILKGGPGGKGVDDSEVPGITPGLPDGPTPMSTRSVFDNFTDSGSGDDFENIGGGGISGVVPELPEPELPEEDENSNSGYGETGLGLQILDGGAEINGKTTINGKTIINGVTTINGDAEVKGRYLSAIPSVAVNIGAGEVGSSDNNPYVIKTGAIYLHTKGENITVKTEFHMAAARGSIIDMVINIRRNSDSNLTLFINGLPIVTYEKGEYIKSQLRVMILGTADNQGGTDVISVSGTHNIDSNIEPFYNLATPQQNS